MKKLKLGKIYKYICKEFTPFYFLVLRKGYKSYTIRIIYKEDDWTIFEEGGEWILLDGETTICEEVTIPYKEDIMLEKL